MHLRPPILLNYQLQLFGAYLDLGGLPHIRALGPEEKYMFSGVVGLVARIQ
jgi:hypothetical protein